MYFKETPKNNDIIDRCPLIKKRKYYPTFFLANGILQTFAASFIATFDNLQIRNEELPQEKTGGISIDWITRTEKVSVSGKSGETPDTNEQETLKNKSISGHNDSTDVFTHTAEAADKKDVLVFIMPGLTGASKDG